MKFFRFLLTIAGCFVLMCILLLGADSLFNLLIVVGGAYAFLLVASVFCILPALLFVAFIIFN